MLTRQTSYGKSICWLHGYGSHSGRPTQYEQIVHCTLVQGRYRYRYRYKAIVPVLYSLSRKDACSAGLN